MANILVIAEVANAGVTRESLETVSLALKLAAASRQPVCGALIGAGDLSNAVAQFQCGFSSLLLVESPQLSTYLAQPFVAAAEAVIRRIEPSLVLFPHSARTRDWAPQLAARLRAGLVLDCVNAEVGEDGLTVTKPMYGGGVWGQLVVHGRPALMSVRGGVFEAATSSAGVGVERLEMQNLSPSSHIHYLESVPIEGGGGRRLKDASTIISGGRGTGGRENWHLIEETAEAMDAEIGCSRAIVDMGWLKWNHQVGLSGTIVAPDLYIAVGISGAVQHLAGISNAKTVVAINNDAEAEIFKRADYGVVGDFKDVLPAFTERVREFRK
jgi:electron transfer flavoprotein alpha subunit